MSKHKPWTIYITQDKHLDYNWCGTQTEIEVRMAALLDGYLDLVEDERTKWNLDSTLWYETYKRQRGKPGGERLLHALRQGRIGWAANHSVLLWGILSTELSVQSFLSSLDIGDKVGGVSDTALIMENPGMPWGVASVVTACGIPYLARGIYDLRAESYNASRQPYPLFWWYAPDGKRVLVHWDMYSTTGAWGGYAEGYRLAELAGEAWDALTVQTFGDRNTDVIYAKRVEYISKTIERYEAYGESFPVSSILLLGTGWDNWSITDDLAAFINRFNAESDWRVRLVDARYCDYFAAVEQELAEKKLTIPELSGSFGIAWDEWAAHLAAPTRLFRQASRLFVHAQAHSALNAMTGTVDESRWTALDQGLQACLRFAEHDFGGVDLKTAAISAGVRAGAAMEANTIFRTLSPVREAPAAVLIGETTAMIVDTIFSWRGWKVHFDRHRMAVVSLCDEQNYEWINQNSAIGLGTVWHALYPEDQLRKTVLPGSLSHDSCLELIEFSCHRAINGVEILATGKRWGFTIRSRWFFHMDHPWIDIVYDLEDGWTDDAQTIQFCFPFTLPNPAYTYDMAGAVLRVGGIDIDGDDLPGANPVLYALQNFAQIYSETEDSARSVIMLSPDAHLVQFGLTPANMGDMNFGAVPSALVSMPMMNLTRTDWLFNQGGENHWQFRYRFVLSNLTLKDCDLRHLLPFQAAQQFAVPPFLQVPGLAPVNHELSVLGIHFNGGPVTAFKRAEDGVRLILRFWNVHEHPVEGTVKLPQTYKSAEITDALERPQAEAELVNGVVYFTVPARSMLTLAFRR